jgi:signal peptidase I
MNLNTIFLANPDVVCHPNGQAVILVNPDTDAILLINPSALLLWQALSQPRTQTQLAAYILDGALDVPCERVSADVDTFLESLLPQGFIGQVLLSDASDCHFPQALPVVEVSDSSVDPDDPSSELAGEGLQRFYRGHSMQGTFRAGDLLTVTPVSFISLKPGDVVIFSSVGHSQVTREVVHRVIAITPEGLLTQGDNNPYPDRHPLTSERLLGCVTQYNRDGRTHPVRCGFWGLVHIRTLNAKRYIRRLGGSFLRLTVGWLYRWLRDSGWVRSFWRVSILRLVVNTSHGPMVKYIHHHRTVAKWRPGYGRFWACRPYDLLIPPPQNTYENSA